MDVDLNENKFYYSSAGHPEQFLILNNELTTVKASGRMIGICENLDYEVKSYNFIKGSKAFLFTDGMFEEFNDEKIEFGLSRFFNIMQKEKSKDIKTITKSIFNELNNFIGKSCPNDDITLIGIEYPLSN